MMPSLAHRIGATGLLLLLAAVGCGRERRSDLISQESLRHQLSTNNFTANELKRRQAEALKHARAMAKEYRKTRKRLTQAKRDYALQDEDRKQMTQRIKKLKAGNAALAAQLKKLAAEQKKWAAQVKTLEASSKKLRAQLGVKLKEKQQVTAQTQAQLAQVTKLKQALDRIRAQVKSLEKQTGSALPRAELLRKLAAQKGELTRLRARQQQIVKELKTLRKNNSKKSPSNN